MSHRDWDRVAKMYGGEPVDEERGEHGKQRMPSDPHSRDEEWVKLRNAVVEGHSETLQEQLKAVPTNELSAKVNKLVWLEEDEKDEKRTLLHWAAMKGSMDCIRILIEAGAEVHVLTALGSGQARTEEALHESGLDGSPKEDKLSYRKLMPLHLAAEGGHTECAQLLIDAGAYADGYRNHREGRERDENGHRRQNGWIDDNVSKKTPLHYAAEAGHAECARLLIERKADVEALDSNEMTPLHYAAKGGHLECSRLLFSKKKVDSNDGNGRTPLHLALEGGHIDVVKFLIDNGAGVNLDDSGTFSKTPLHYATEAGHAECARLLIERRADVEALDNKRMSPLHYAAKGGHLECARLLLDKRAVNSKDGNGRSPLHLALEGGHIDVVKFLVENGSGVNLYDNGARTPLHIAAKGGYINCARVLIENKANVNAVDENNRTPLHFVAEKGFVDILRLLLVRGSNINQADNQGRTAAYFAGLDPSTTLTCLDVLVFEYDVRFQSKHSALLTRQEKHARLIFFAVAAAVIIGSVYGYLTSGHLTTTCDAAIGGLLLQPYLFDFVTVFVFKVFQYAFEELLSPAFDFLWFWVRSHQKGKNKDLVAAAKEKLAAVELSRPTTASSRRASQRVSMELAYRDSIPSEVVSTAENPIAINSRGSSLRISVGSGDSDTPSGQAGDVEMAVRQPVEVNASPSVTERASPQIATAFIRFLYRAFTKEMVSAWRKKKYLAAEKADPDYHPYTPPFDVNSSLAQFFPCVLLCFLVVIACFPAVKDPDTPEEREAKRKANAHKTDFWYQTPYLFLYLQTTTALISICVAAAHVDRSLPASQQYSNFFAVVTNSGAPTQVFSLFVKMAVIDKRWEQMQHLPAPVKFFVCIPALVLLAPFFSHIFPAIFTYIWIIIFGCLALICFGFCYVGTLKTASNYHLNFFAEIAGRFVFIFLFHSLFTYAALFYASDKSPHAYIDVIAQDFHLRSQSHCFINQATSSARGLVTLFSWF